MASTGKSRIGSYTSPVDILLSLGECHYPPWSDRNPSKWINYSKHGLSQEHISELTRLATDEGILSSDLDDATSWAPIHAWRALGQLKAVVSVNTLFENFLVWQDFDWIVNEASDVFKMMGPDVINILIPLLQDRNRSSDLRQHVSEHIANVAKELSSEREKAIHAIAETLTKYEVNSKQFNGFLISALLDLQAIEAIELIREVYIKKRTILALPGDLEDAEISLGLREKRSTPKPHYGKLGIKEMEEEVGPRKPYPYPLGSTTFNRGSANVGRNDPCPCGSGKKFKKCCLN
ncbi:SEC-C motif domain protein [Magnetococcus marinus MC-1]|uniref:SEC-C motif domain protein n=1 Tax=Magnetococcus marinus (strain ATCC BAA-1437 / JCM 17883 / MC-1) TaxID=156889 RepID=A0LBD0_MAGMM|nr:SEC-C metal-binding domain-containing protein [Magnetococcus marinus]ABK45273.1 SEC-C motif domain protein [Magnetococcus marinus MC-1]